MTAAGSSATDAYHQVTDAAWGLLGMGGGAGGPGGGAAQEKPTDADGSSMSSSDEEAQPGEGQATQEAYSQKHQPTGKQLQESNTAAAADGHNGQDDQSNAQGSSWLTGWMPAWGSGPGNHPDNPNATINHPNQDGTIDAKPNGDSKAGKGDSSASAPRAKPHGIDDEADAEADEGRNKAINLKSLEHKKDAKSDALARALNREPNRGAGHRDDEEDQYNRKADPWSVDFDGKESNENMQQKESKSKKKSLRIGHKSDSDSDRPAEEEIAPKRERHPLAYSTKPQHDDHPAHRGPMWASRPDDAQRQKLKEMKRKKMQQLREEKRKAKKEADGSSASSSDEGEGEDGNTKGNGAQASGANGAQRPGKNRTQSSKLQSFLGVSRANKGSKPSQHDAGQQEPDQDGKQDAGKGFRGVLGAYEGAPTGDGDPYRHQNQEPPKEEKDKSAGQGKAAPNGSATHGDDASPDHAKLNKISKLMLSKDDANGEATGDGAARSGDDGEGGGATTSSDRWALLKQRVQATGAVAKRRADKQKEQSRKRVLGGLDMTAELQSGILPVFMLKMALERDEAGHRRVPVLLNHLHLKVTDSVNPLHNTSAVFRIELSYGDDMIKWVIYRTLGDFIALHTHYRAAALKGIFGRAVGDKGTPDGEIGLPRFPKTSLPYFRQLQSQGGMKSGNARKVFARVQRDALEDYIVALVRRTMFRPEANRLCKFFEMSALGISLASRGGFQGKQGYLRVLSRGGRKTDQVSVMKPSTWIHGHEPKWFVVRESYIAICPGPETLEVHDVFMIDGEFRVERPKRFYKQATHLASEIRQAGKDGEKSGGEKGGGEKGGESGAGKQKIGIHDRSDNLALLTEGQFKHREGDAGTDSENESDPGKRKAAVAKGKARANTNVSSHTFYICNAERRLKLSAKSDRILEQFIASMERVARQSCFAGSNRFGSFAPIRLNVNAQWLVDGRDYYWEVSRALLLAKDRIMIHDWWLSPELYLRRPGEPKWRLDNILQKKAQEGVKVFVILYNEVSNNFTPTDSGYTKSRLSALHPNIYVQRSPTHFQTGTFFWAHHEKMCAIDETIAFMGGFDLCFGRYDTAAHVLVDDVETDYQEGNHHAKELLGPPTKDGKEAHVWPGQDYANERVAEWSDLTKPAQDLFDRTKFPRMPWHDTGLQLIGQPARDLSRHFTQRWNYLLRNKNHKRKFPFLVPAPDFTVQELEKYQLTGTCETQICRSAGPWSLGTSKTVEHSIQNAYLKCIQMSDHFVYIENQFFVTSTVVEGTAIENNIGNALVSRIIRAHREGTPWRAIIVIPLIPGFPMPISEPDASSVRIICDCQFRSICRGEHSIFGKLRREGIDPDQYISFFSLRNWGKLRGGQLTTEQVYIHGKCAMFDDRIVIIGSANINERSQRGDRDSELACVIRDTDMIESRMGGKPYMVGRFAHTLRVRLMREHVGIDVDELDAKEANLDLSEMQGKETTEQKSDAEKKKSKASENGQPNHQQQDGEHSDQRKKPLTKDEEQWDPDDEERKGVDEAAEGNITRSKHEIHRGRELSVHAGTAMKDMARGARKQTRDFMVRPTQGKTLRDNPVDDADEANVNEEGEERGEDAHADELKRQDNLKTLLGDREGDADPKLKDSSGFGVDSEPEKGLSQEERKKEDLSTTLEERLLSEMHQSGGDKGEKAEEGDRAYQSEGEGEGDEDYDYEADSQSRRHDRAKTEEPEPMEHRTRHMDHSASAPTFGKTPKEEARKKINAYLSPNPWQPPISVPEINTSTSFHDPISDPFYRDIWLAAALHNTQIYRKVFRCVPDDTITNWSEYKAFMAWSDRLSKSGNFSGKEGKEERGGIPVEARGPGAQHNRAAGAKDGLKAKVKGRHGHSSSDDEDASADLSEGKHEEKENTSSSQAQGDATGSSPSSAKDDHKSSPGTHQPQAPPGSATTSDGSFSQRELEQMEALLDQTVGNLVVFPTRFLETEDRANNFLFPMDRINPLNVYS
ncbi:phospholipase D [Microstroma glucosiphilum]|uniref:Phospholipase D1 n=1 Tax=Pseudomicrostroma glucosiphilum TaxID=1684307 RepID=A0A316TX05_9BASI|nr:phospholipase D [Pseudomicrostroma glucosiphilum]PWN18006.1 phospholipase D [Pseudomicrostroma glucosiphilum]